MDTIEWTISLYRGRGTEDSPRQYRTVNTLDIERLVERKGRALFMRPRSEYGDWIIASITKQSGDSQLYIYYSISRREGQKMHISQELIGLIPEVPEPIYVP